MRIRIDPTKMRPNHSLISTFEHAVSYHMKIIMCGRSLKWKDEDGDTHEGSVVVLTRDGDWQ